jgi:hypothetical protein
MEGALLGDGLLLGDLLGRSVGHGILCPKGDGCVTGFLHKPMWVIAVGP